MENNFREVMESRTNEELIKIVTIDRENYQQMAVVAAEQEINKRQLDTNLIEKVNQSFKIAIEEKKAIATNLVSSWTRLLHFVIDFLAILIIYFIISLIIGFLYRTNDLTTAYFLGALVFLISFLGYYFGLESTYQKTLAKFITGTKVVKSDGQKPDSSEIALRTFTRLLPFDRISYIFTKNGFHDSFSKTIVIKDSN
jgi:uncharacterized RDD family membrane protein YckC